MSGGVLSEYDTLTYVFVRLTDGGEAGVKRWYICPFIKISAGDRVEAPSLSATAAGEVLRVERVTAQTAPFPVKHTKEIVRVISPDKSS